MTELEKSGELLETQGNRPFLINEPDYVWIVKEKSLNLYGVYLKDKHVSSVRNYICSLEKGDVIWGQEPDDNFAYLAAGESGTKVLKIKVSELKDKSSFYMNKWIEIFTKALVRGLLPPVKSRLLEDDIEIEIKKDENILSPESVLWVKHLEGSSIFIGREDFPSIGGDLFFPLSRYIWLIAKEDSKIKAVTTEAYTSQEPDKRSFQEFQRFISDFIKIRLVEKNIKEKESLEKKEEEGKMLFRDSLLTIAGTMEKDEALVPDRDKEDPLFTACSMIGKIQGIDFIEPLTREKGKELDSPLNAIVRATGIRTRQVILQGKWWKKDSGPILAFMEENKRPLAILPSSPGSYEVFDPVENKREKVTEEKASKLSPEAFIFYKSLPHKILAIRDLLKLQDGGSKKDLLNFIFIGICAGFLGMLVPVVTGVIFDHIIPGAEVSQLMQLALVLFVSSISVLMFQFAQAIALLRIEGKFKGNLQAAVWDRILTLPCSFFRQFSSGDLAVRALGINLISDQLFGGLLLPSILGIIYAGFNFFLLFYYDRPLAIIGSLFALIIFIATGLTSYFQLSYLKKSFDLQGKISGFVFQLIKGVAKITVSASQERAFTKWVQLFSLQKKYSFKTGVMNIYMSIFNSVFPPVASIVIFTFVALQINNAETSEISTGNFLAFNAAFTSFTAALMQLGITIASLTNMVPVFNRMKPIFETIPEVDMKKPDPGELHGEIEVSHISFRYNTESKLILNDISFLVEPGEFVAFIGPSGAGKSTLFRLLLGFETPESGSLYYDGKNLNDLDFSAVRRQIGVVLQSNKLMAGEIYYNIIGSSLLTIDDAWEAAERAGIADDIRAMPMGMHTFISEGGETFSGGQKQRLLIARALARKPRIIFFDEATSALDNRTQNIVTESLSKINATRIIIAHRLSTVIKADRIYVLDRGRIVQTGNYEELINVEGPFKEFAKRHTL